jgi:hypothetical protein
MHYIHKEIKEPFKDGIEIGMELNNKIKNPSLIILLTSLTKKEDIEELIKGLKTHIDVNNLIGCTTAGEFSEKGYTRHGALLVAFDKRCKVAMSCKKLEGDSKNIGIELANDIKEKLKEKYSKININEKLIGIVCHDWNSDQNEILNDLAKELSFPIIGTTAGDDLKLENMYQIYQGKVLSGHVVFATLSAMRKLEFLYGHGYEPTEYYARITKASGNVIYELDGKPAYEVYIDMISKFSGISAEILEKYKPNYNNKKFGFNILYPLGIQSAYGNYILLFIIDSEDNKLIVNHKVREGTFLTLMNTSPKKTVDSLYNEISKLKNFKKPIAFIVECVGRDMIKNPSLYKHAFVSEDFEKWIGRNNNTHTILSNCIGILSYGESIVKNTMRFHNTLTFVGVAFDLEDGHEINWKEALRYFDFSDEELMIITELINSNLSAKELLNKLDISQTKLYATLNDLEEKRIIKALGKKPKKYYVDDIKGVLEKIDIELESQYQFKKRKRKEFLSKL